MGEHHGGDAIFFNYNQTILNFKLLGHDLIVSYNHLHIYTLYQQIFWFETYY
jgi:hypothetical protein